MPQDTPVTDTTEENARNSAEIAGFFGSLCRTPSEKAPEARQSALSGAALDGSCIHHLFENIKEPSSSVSSSSVTSPELKAVSTPPSCRS